MRSMVNRLAASAAALAPLWVVAAEEPARRFAAPDTATTLPGGSTSGIGQVTLALLIVLAVVFALAFALKKMRAITGAGSNGIEVLGQASLGSRERAVVIRVDGSRLLLGVAAGHVSLLQVLPPSPASPEPQPPASDAGTPPTFVQLLRKSLGR